MKSSNFSRAFLKGAVFSLLLFTGLIAIALSQRKHIYALEKFLFPAPRLSRLDSKNLFKRYTVETSIATTDDVLITRNSLKNLLLSKAAYSLEANKGGCKNVDDIAKNDFVCDELYFKEDHNVDSIVYFFRPKAGNNKLVVWHQGHNGDFREWGREVVGKFLSEGYDVMAFDMPLIGKNPIPDSLLSQQNKHSALRFYESSERHLLSYFLTPVVLGIDYALDLSNYSTVSMVGISGGGWTTVLSSALDNRIDMAFSVAGSLPLDLRTEDYHIRDAEAIYPSFYKKFPYLDLYILGSVSNSGRRREHTQISFIDDTCCYSGDRSLLYSQQIGKIASDLGGSFNIRIEDQSEHKIKSVTSDFILDKIRSFPQITP